MGSFVYLYRKIVKNSIKKAAKKPVTYLFLIFILLYIVVVLNSFGTLIREFRIDNTRSLAVILSGLIFFILPSNFISYSRRKGLLFKKANVHFMFPAPVNPKQVLLFTGSKNLFINFILAIIYAVFGILYFQAGVWQMLLYFALYLVLENVLEGSMQVLCYGNETLPERFFKVLTVICYTLMAVFVAVAVLLMYQKGPSFAVLDEYLSLPVIQLIPVIGWNIAMIRLIFVEPTILNVVCTVLFCLFALALFILAYRAKCVGEYYEDAAKFADDYEVLRANKRKGIASVSVGKKKKFKKAKVEYKGSYAKAIFYRQLLEYKKSKFFIFGLTTLINLIIGIGIAVMAVVTDMASDAGASRIFIIPGIMAYIIFCFSGYATKWSRELENPYTFLIPDGSFKKMWYATKMEHIRAVIDGMLITLPGAAAMKLSPVQTLLIILFYVGLMANKLYLFMLADYLVGHFLGVTGRTLVKMLFQMIVIGIAAAAAVIGGFIGGMEVGLAVMIIVTLALTFLGALGAAMSFEKMEVSE